MPIYQAGLGAGVPAAIAAARGALTAGRTAVGAITPFGVGRVAGRGYSIARTLFKKGTSKKVAEAAGWIGIGAFWYDLQSGQIMGRRTQRRMNPLNHRALRRAIRRVKGATRICREVERITAPRRRGSRSSGGRARAEAACR